MNASALAHRQWLTRSSLAFRRYRCVATPGLSTPSDALSHSISRLIWWTKAINFSVSLVLSYRVSSAERRIGPEGPRMTDGELVSQTLAGRTQAYEELVRRWAGRITALCHAHTRCAAAADDLAQEALLRGYRSLASLEAPDRFGAWLCRIAQRTCLNWLKAKERTDIAFSALGTGQDPEDVLYRRNHREEPADRDEDLARLRAEVAALPAVYREVLVLYYHEKTTYRDIAQLLDVSPATVNARLTRARAMLRERLQNLCHR